MQFQDVTPSQRHVLVKLDANDMAELQSEYDSVKLPETTKVVLEQLLGIAPSATVTDGGSSKAHKA